MKKRIASIARQKIDTLFSQKKREPSLRLVLLHTTLIECILDEIDPPLRETDKTSIVDENIIRSKHSIIASRRNVWEDVSEHPTGCATGDVVPKTMDASMAIVMGILTDVC